VVEDSRGLGLAKEALPGFGVARDRLGQELGREL
jgi:hypothetical protein